MAPSSVASDMRSPFSRDDAQSSAGHVQPATESVAGAARATAGRGARGRTGPGGLRVVVLPALDADAHEVARALAERGHDVTLLDWRPGPVAGAAPSVGALPTGRAAPGGRVRRLALLVPHRPDTWVAVGRRLRGVDAIVVPDAESRRSPARRLVLAVACSGRWAHRPQRWRRQPAVESGGRPFVARWPSTAQPGDLDDLLAGVTASARRGDGSIDGPDPTDSVDHGDAAPRGLRALRPVRRTASRPRYADISAHVRPSAVLVDTRDADAARRWARRAGLRGADPVAAWDAAGGVAALLLLDRGGRAVTLVDQSGPRSPMRRWATRLGFDVVGGGDLVGGSMSLSSLDVAAGSVDVVTQLHPVLVAPVDLDLVLADAAWMLRAGGLLVITLALVASGADAFGPAELRALVARAHDAGFTLVGDIDADLGDDVRDGQWDAPAGETYGLVRLALRRRA